MSISTTLSARFHPEQRAGSRPNPIRGKPFLGVAPDLKQDAPGFLLDCARRHGPFVSMKAAGLTCHLVADPDAIDHVLRRHADHYQKHHFVDKFKPIMGDSIITANGDRWAASRRIIQPILTARGVDRVLSEMDREITDTLRDITDHENQTEMRSQCGMLTLRVLARTIFGNLGREHADSIVRAVDDLQDNLRSRMWSALPFSDYLPTPSNRRFSRSRRFSLDIIDNLIAQSCESAAPGYNVVEILKNAVDTTTGTTMSRRQIRNEVATLFFAGHETTGNMLSWLFHHLSQNPEIQERLRQEIFECVDCDRTPSIKDLQNMPYTRAVIEETLRLNPAAFWFVRTCREDDCIQGRTVKKGDVMLIAPYVTHRLETHWADPDDFRPERFLDGRPSHRYAYIPFGAGARTCPGGHFAMAEMSLVLARFLARAEATPAQAGNGTPEAMVTLRPKGGLPMRIRPIRRAVRIHGAHRGRHATLDACMRLRKRVFVDIKGWPVDVDADHREHDAFDGENAHYIGLVAGGRVVATARALPLDGPSLLTDVFPWLVDGNLNQYKQSRFWEGARLVVDPDLPKQQSHEYLVDFLYEAVQYVREHGVHALLTVSDPIMERVLKRAGARPHRLGPIQHDRNGFPVLGLYIPCSDATLAALAGHGDPAPAGASRDAA